MKYYLLVLLALCLLPLTTWAQKAPVDTTRGRYHRPVFRQVQVRHDVEFAHVTTMLGLPQTLYMDVYEPVGDTVRRRPLVVLAHEGGFLTGTRDDAVMTALCTRLARLGYVTATIDYRLYFFPFDTVGIGRAAIRATQDMRAAVRFFRHDAATAKRFRVHPQYVFVGGSSAGGFMALQTGYLNKPSEVPAYLDIAALGGLEGNGGNAGYSSRPRGVVNLCGALARANWLEAGDPPLCSVHGTRDGLVPYAKGTIGAQLPAQLVYGSGALRVRANAVGVPNVLRRLRGAGHVPYSFEPTYIDSAFFAVRDFLRPLLGTGAPGPLLAAALNPRREAQTTALLLPRRPMVQLPPAPALVWQPNLLKAAPDSVRQPAPVAPEATGAAAPPE
ncbi:alpha/beta hydrolase [Hymenobacter swuensis]|uniref:BD-FAE-like domain-containing protein n=1 Tax=Hymenobacter swuensis DY53 TaxID=1227739 RepID=W8F9H9_9BACT|nr:alpha/beta hydrolase [Hymenobacter swuensis]AHJ99306.1 hypothetical protein Hsw_3711 [Hymenobacter swuensis DY53]